MKQTVTSENEMAKDLPTFKESMGTEMVDLYVGPSKEHFRVHKSKLCTRVPYFEKMFNGGFQEASSSSATFPEDTSASFDLLLEWVYSNTIRPLEAIKMSETNYTDSWDSYEFYNLAEKFCIPYLQDRIMDLMREFDETANSMPGTTRIRMVYEKSSPSSPLRKYVSQTFAYVLTAIREEQSNWRMEDLSQLITEDVDLARDVLTMLRRSWGNIIHPLEAPNCDFHCHANGEPCYKDLETTN